MEMVQDGNKGLLRNEAYALLEALQKKHTPGSNPLYMHRNDYPAKEFLELDLQKLRLLEDDGALSISEYTRPGTGTIDPNVIVLTLLEKAQERLKSLTITTTTTQTITPLFEEPEEPQWKVNKRHRNFVRTERGFGITTSSPEGLASNVRGHISALRLGDMKRSEWKSRQIWLMYALLYRYDEIPEPLRVEAEDYRDLPFTSRHKPQRKHREISSVPLEARKP